MNSFYWILNQFNEILSSRDCSMGYYQGVPFIKKNKVQQINKILKNSEKSRKIFFFFFLSMENI